MYPWFEEHRHIATSPHRNITISPLNIVHFNQERPRIGRRAIGDRQRHHTPRSRKRVGKCAQILFGFSVGLIYYSSLYYSMDVGEASGAHGGFHEAALGVGIFAGPAVGATTLFLFPHYARDRKSVV